MSLITYDILKKICPSLNQVRGNAVVKAINEVCPLYGINTADILHEFLANVIHECNEFRNYSENLNYTAKRLMQVWPTRFATIDAAAPYANNPRKLGNKVYGGRMGNVQSGDGYRFRGGGPIQLTGRTMYTNFTTYMRQHRGITKTVQEWADLIRTDHVWAMHSACWFFAVAKGLIQLAIDDEMTKIVKRINGGYNGLSERNRYYELCKKYIV